MFNAKMTRFASLLLAFGLLLGLAVTGCSDKDRDNGKEPVKMKTMTYSFDLVDGNKVVANGVPETAEFLNIVALSRNNEHVDAKLAETEIDKMALDGGSYVAQAEYAEDAVCVIYTFYYMEGDQKVAVCNRAVGVADLKDGENVDESDEQNFELTSKFVDVQDPDAKNIEVVAGGDIFVQIFGSCSLLGPDPVNLSSIEGAYKIESVSGENKLIVPIGYDADKDAVMLTAVRTGKDNLVLTFDGIKMLDVAEVNIIPALYFAKAGEFKVDDEGHASLDDGDTWLTSPEALVNGCVGTLPSGEQDTVKYRPLAYVGLDSNGLCLFDIGNVPDVVTIDKEGTGAEDVTATYAGGYLTLDIADTTAPQDSVTINVSAAGFGGNCPIVITFN